MPIRLAEARRVWSPLLNEIAEFAASIAVVSKIIISGDRHA